MGQYFAGKLEYTAPNGVRWSITRKQAAKGARYWHADVITENGAKEEHLVSVSAQRLLQNIDHPEMGQVMTGDKKQDDEWLKWLKTAPMHQLIESLATRDRLLQLKSDEKLGPEWQAIMDEIRRRKENGE